MIHFKDEAGKLWSYEDYVEQEQIRPGLVRISDEEFAAIQDPLKPIAVIAASLQALVDAEYKRNMGLITAKYPEEERSSWYIQTAQAQSVLSGSAAATPWLDACAQTRGLTREELAERITVLDTGFQAIHGFLTGVRQLHEDAIGAIVNAALENEVQAREDLANYDVLQGWQPTT